MTIDTIGHSPTAIERFIDPVRSHLIQVLIDTPRQPTVGTPRNATGG